MFIRWQKKGNKKYGHLEERKRVGGKVVTHYISYIGIVEKAPGKLFDLMESGVIDEGQYTSLYAGLPEPDKGAGLGPGQGQSSESGSSSMLGPGARPGTLEALKAELDTWTEGSIMKEFPDLSSHMAHQDGVRHMLKKLEGIKGKFPEVWTI